MQGCGRRFKPNATNKLVKTVNFHYNRGVENSIKSRAFLMPETRTTTLVDVQSADATHEAHMGSIKTLFSRYRTPCKTKRSASRMAFWLHVHTH